MGIYGFACDLIRKVNVIPQWLLVYGCHVTDLHIHGVWDCDLGSQPFCPGLIVFLPMFLVDIAHKWIDILEK